MMFFNPRRKRLQNRAMDRAAFDPDLWLRQAERHGVKIKLLVALDGRTATYSKWPQPVPLDLAEQFGLHRKAISDHLAMRGASVFVGPVMPDRIEMEGF